MLTGTLTGTPTTLSEQPRTSTNAKSPYKPQEGYAGTPANAVLRIPLSAPSG